MQSLLSQRPGGSHGGSDFTMLRRAATRTVRMAIPIETRRQLPTWTGWLKAYSQAIDYSVRQIRRLVLGEKPVKTLKECSWSKGDHNRVLDAAFAAFNLVEAIKAGVDTVELCERIIKIRDSIPDSLIENGYTETRRVVRRKPPRRGTE
jgi:hypothetical protein